MATPMEEGVHEGSFGKLQLKQEPDTGSLESQIRLSPNVDSEASESREKKVAELDKPNIVPSDMQQRQGIVNGSSASQSHERKNSHSAIQGKDGEEVRLKGDSRSDNDASQFSQVSIVPKEEVDDTEHEQRNDERKYVTESLARSIVPYKASDNPQQLQIQSLEVLAAHSNEERVTYIKGHEKGLDKLQPRRNPEIGAHASQFDQRSGKVPEKPSEDGYNWRKYGQKLVRGNEFFRSYYKCTHFNCTAKRQVERSQDGHITEINYIGNHEHPKPQSSPQVSAPTILPIQAIRPDVPVVTASEGTQSVTPGGKCETPETKQTPLPQGVASADAGTQDSIFQSHKLQDEDDNSSCPDSKKQKKYHSSCDDNKPHGEPRHIVQTMSDVDLVNDGYRWRKYGQKFVKGNPNPRSYYRCSNTGCMVKKHIERASHDPKLVITTYEGQHNHDMPPCRTITQNSGEGTTVTNRESRPETSENKHVGLEMVLHISAN